MEVGGTISMQEPSLSELSVAAVSNRLEDAVELHSSCLATSRGDEVWSQREFDLHGENSPGSRSFPQNFT